MSLVVVNNYENMFNLKRFLRVIIVDDNQYDAQISINSIKQISNDIPISILTHDCAYEQYDGLEVIKGACDKNILSVLNRLLSDKTEDFFCILKAGDVLLNEFLKSSQFNYDVSSVGAIIFDDVLNGEKNFKPGFSPDLYLEDDYVHNSLFINLKFFNLIGGFNINLQNNFIRDMIFRLYSKDYKILKEDFINFNINSIEDDMLEDKIFLINELNSRDVKYEISAHGSIIKPIYNAQNKKVSIIIPFKDQADVTRKCIGSIIDKTEYSNYEIILINNNSSEDGTFSFMDELRNVAGIKIFDYFDSFNWSKINNFGFSKSSGDVLVFLNNDTEVISRNWLSLLVGDAIQDKVGAVGAKLFYPDNTIQHVGVVIGLNNLASHLFAGNKENQIPDLYNNHRRNISAVTGACLAIEKDLFKEIGGFNERFEVSFSDVELCLRLLKRGYNNIFNPDVKLYHHEMKTRSNKEFREIDRILAYDNFSFYFENGDPFFNKNFSLNNSKSLVEKKEDEVPGFENYWNDWSKDRDARTDAINSIICKNSSVYEYDVSNDDLIKNGILMDDFFTNPISDVEDVLWFIPNLDNMCEDKLYNLISLPNFLSVTEGTYNIFVLRNDVDASKLNKYAELNFPNLKYVTIMESDPQNLPKSDISFCFDWKTAYKLIKYDKCLAKFYVIDNPHINQDTLIKRQSYHFDFIGISNSNNFICKYKKFNRCAEFFNPVINKNIYYSDNKINKINKSLLFHINDLSDDELAMGLEILHVLKEYFGDDIDIFIEGSEFDGSNYDLENIVNLGILDSSKELASIYKKCMAVLTFSSSVDVINKILNSMACGCVNITTFNEDLPDLFKNNENIVFTGQTVTCIFEDIIRILQDENMLEKIVHNGFNTVKNLNQNAELKKMVDFIKNPPLV